MTTRGESATETAPAISAAPKGPNAEATRTRARVAGSAVTERAQTLVSHWVAQGQATAGQWTSSGSLWAASPASPAELRAYIHSAAWVPGDAPILELAGRAYGYLVALPVSLALYGTAWLLQRPGRFLLAGLIGLVIWLTA